MKELYPKDFLLFWKSIKKLNDVVITDIVIKPNKKDFVNIKCKVNNYDYEMWLSFDWLEMIGSFYYIESSENARKLAISTVIHRLPDYFESVYVPWIENDSGIKVDDEYLELINIEFERLTRLI